MNVKLTAPLASAVSASTCEPLTISEIVSLATNPVATPVTLLPAGACCGVNTSTPAGVGVGAGLIVSEAVADPLLRPATRTS